MRCWINLSRQALLHNYQTLKTLAAPAKFVPIIKANAYGHGLPEVYEILASENPPWLGVNYLFEAQKLRQLGFKNRIMIVGPVREDAIEEAADLNLDIFIPNEILLTAWLKAQKKPDIHIKFDTGMSRQGFLPDAATELTKNLLNYKSKVKGVCSHFSNVEDVLEQQYAQLQMERFIKVKATFKEAGFQCNAHIGASASTLILQGSLFDLVRVGISLYGLWPSQATRLSYMQLFSRLPALKPVLEWKTEIASLKMVKAGQFIGYGCTYRAVHDMLVAVLPVGYYEGFPRLAGNNLSYVLLHGQRCSVVGRICMNMMMVDVSHIKQTKIGDTVTLIGRDGDEEIDAAQAAEWAQTIHYELLTRLCSEIPRRIKE